MAITIVSTTFASYDLTNINRMSSDSGTLSESPPNIGLDSSTPTPSFSTTSTTLAFVVISVVPGTIDSLVLSDRATPSTLILLVASDAAVLGDFVHPGPPIIFTGILRSRMGRTSPSSIIRNVPRSRQGVPIG